MDADPSVPQPAIRVPPPSTIGTLVELLLKEPERVDALLVDRDLQRQLLPRFIGIGLLGFSLFGTVLAILLDLAEASLPLVPPARWSDGSSVFLVLAYDLGLIAACGVCLPSFYFFGLLAGVEATMLETALHGVKSLAANAVALAGLLPVYLACALGAVVFEAGEEVVTAVCYGGLLLPFLSGLWGVRSLYFGFVRLADHLPEEVRKSRRHFLQRLLLAWSVVYTVVSPVMIYRLWERLAS